MTPDCITLPDVHESHAGASDIASCGYGGAGVALPSHMLCLILLIAAVANGCLARQVAEDGMGIRRALVDMYTDQALDNLIRAHENRPFVQLKYSQLAIKDTDDAMATVNGGDAEF